MLTFEAQGFQCIIRRMSTGHLCGYVGITKSHRWYGIYYADFARLITVHGGVTFSDHWRWDGDLPDENVWWIGFSCTSEGDYIPYDDRPSIGNQVYRDMSYVMCEVEGLALQLSQIKKRSILNKIYNLLRRK